MKKIIFIFLLFTSFNLKAVELKGEFILNETINSFKEGDVISAMIRLWPLEEESSQKQIKELEGRVFFNSLKLLHIDDIRTSENNAEVVEVFGTFVASSAVVNPQGHLRFNDQNIQLTLKNVDVSELKEKSEVYFIEEQSILKNVNYKMFLTPLAVLIVLIFLFKNKIQQYYWKLTKRDLKNKIARYSKMLSSAKSRADFEEIYRLREDLKQTLTQKNGFDSFLRSLDKIQFKRDWSESDLASIQSEFSRVKWSFK